MLALINALIDLSLAYFLISQIILPSIKGKILFPAFRRKLRRLKSEKSSLEYKEEVFDAESEVQELKEHVETKTNQPN